MNTLLNADLTRYSTSGKMPLFQKCLRRYQEAKNPMTKCIFKLGVFIFRKMNSIDISCSSHIGGGLYIGHPYGITVNPEAVIGENCNIHKGVTIGQENRGKRKGAPTIGNKVWMGVNSTIVGNITIGDDVLIAPNSYVNFDVPPHSIVIGNPGKIIHRENATQDYINNLYVD